MLQAEKTSRLNLRLPEQQHIALKDAAAMSGTSVTDFVLMPAIERAQALLAAARTTEIHAEVAASFVHWLDEPGRVVAEMKPLANAEPFDET